MRILITGGAGFLGSHLVDRFLDRGDRVVVIDSFITGRQVNLAHRDGDPLLTILDHDVALPLPPWLDGDRFDAVYHLASPASPVGYARYPIETLLANSAGTKTALDLAAAHEARFVLASTSEVYGDPLVHPQREDYWGNVNSVGPRACYDEAKRFAESLTMEYHRQQGADARIARIFNTYGPRSDPDDGRVVPNFCVQALRGEPITIYGDGRQTRSFCYVDDLIDGLLVLGERQGLGGAVINLGNPAELSIRAFAETVVELAGGRAEIRYRPRPTDDPTRRQPDIGRARALLDWEPRVELREGLTRTIAYFAEALALPAR